MAKMKKKDLDFFENLLNNKKETLLKELGYFEKSTGGTGDGSGETAGGANHPADHASDAIDTEQAFRLASREGKYLNFIEKALHKIKDQSFGICESCEKLIPRARLEAVPTAKMCIECKTAKENTSKL